MSNVDYIEIGTKTILDVFNEKLSKVALEFTKKHLPFDEPCARLDFRDKLEAIEKEHERVHGYLKPEAIKVDMEDLEKYGNSDNFELEEDQEDIRDILQDGMKKTVTVRHILSYRCKRRGHGISVFVPMEDYEKMRVKKRKEE